MKGKAKAAEFVEQAYQIHVTGRDVLITDAMKNYAIEKISKVERLSTHIIDVAVTMDIQKLMHRVDIVLKVDHIKVKSHALTTDMYVSIDQAVDKLEKQLYKYKSRIQDHNAKARSVIDLKVNVFKRPEEEELMDINLAIEEANHEQLVQGFGSHYVVSQETRPLKKLSLDESMMKMELSGDAFLIFRSEEDEKLKVIYRRKDQNFGLIELES